MCHRDNTCQRSRSPWSGQIPIRFRGYRVATAVLIVSHAEFEIDLFDQWSCYVCHVCDRVVRFSFSHRRLLVISITINSFALSLGLFSPQVVYIFLSLFFSLAFFFVLIEREKRGERSEGERARTHTNERKNKRRRRKRQSWGVSSVYTYVRGSYMNKKRRHCYCYYSSFSSSHHLIIIAFLLFCICLPLDSGLFTLPFLFH